MTAVDFTHGYQPPGVYIDEDATPLVSVTGVPPTLVALVGPSVGSQKNVEQVPLADIAVRLARQGIVQASVVVTRVDTGAVVPDTDYDLTPSGATTSPDFWTDLVRAVAAGTTANTLVNVSYSYTDPNFFVAKKFENYEDVKDAYGEPLNLVPQALGDPTYVAVLSPLSLAAKFAFENGAAQLVLCATAPMGTGSAAVRSAAGRTALAAALASIETDYAINVVVPITDGIIAADAINVGLDLTAHLNSTANDGFFRFGILGFDPAVGQATAPDVLLNTGAFRDRRLMVAYAAPQGMNFYNGGSNQYLSLGHQYLAAAYAGRMAALATQKSLTREIIRSFSGIAGMPLSNSLKNQYAAAGVAITEIDRLGQMTVRHAVTTDPTNVNTRESAVVRAKDALITLVQTGTERAGLIGQPIDETTTLSVKSVVSGLLENAKSSGLVVDYQDLAVRLRSTDPSVIEVKFAYRPAYPLNYIVVSFSINVTTGTVTNVTSTDNTNVQPN